MTKISGDFLTFIDSDDYLEPHAWSVCMEALEKETADLVCFGWQDHLADGTLVDHCITQDFSMSTLSKHLEMMKNLTPMEDELADGSKHVYLPRQGSHRSEYPLRAGCIYDRGCL